MGAADAVLLDRVFVNASLLMQAAQTPRAIESGWNRFGLPQTVHNGFPGGFSPG